jgi:predicted dehydrogenase
MTTRTRIAQLGITHPHGPGYLENLVHLPEVEVVALYDPDPSRAGSHVPVTLQRCPLYGDLDELLDREHPEAVLICLPNDVTPGAIARAAGAGAHVYAEKPCARSAAEFLPAAEAIRRAGVQFATGYQRRFSPVGRAIRDMVQQGLLGRLISIEARWITSSVKQRDPAHFLFSHARSGGGMVHWLGCHWLDFMRWSTAAEVVEVSAILATLSGEPIDVEDMATLSLRFDNGMLGSLHCAYAVDGKSSEQQFFGLRGTLGSVTWEGSGLSFQSYSSHPDWAASPGRTVQFTSDRAGGYGGAVGLAHRRQFIASIRDGGSSGFTTDDALRVLEILDAAHQSNETGCRVAVTHHSESA